MTYLHNFVNILNSTVYETIYMHSLSFVSDARVQTIEIAFEFNFKSTEILNSVLLQ